MKERKKRRKGTKPIVKKKKKVLYKIGHLTEMLGITPRTIRYYDQYGLLPHVKRSDGRVRLFDDEDIELIKKIRRMQKDEFLPLEIIKEKLLGKKISESDRRRIVVTDSTAAISPDLIKNLNIQVIPLSIFIGNESFTDDSSITPKELWEKCRESGVRAQTQPPSEEDFMKLYGKLSDMGYKEIYSIHLSETFSDTVLNARSASHKVADRVVVTVVDSLSAGGGLGLLVQQVAEAIQRNESSEEISMLITKSIPLIFDIMALNTLKYIASGVKSEDIKQRTRERLISRLFDFKPVLSIRKGELDVLECSRDKMSAINYPTETFHEQIRLRGGYVKQIAINYDYLYGEAIELINQIKSIYKNTSVSILQGSAVLSVYVGPESLSISII